MLIGAVPLNNLHNFTYLLLFVFSPGSDGLTNSSEIEISV